MPLRSSAELNLSILELGFLILVYVAVIDSLHIFGII